MLVLIPRRAKRDLFNLKVLSERIQRPELHYSTRYRCYSSAVKENFCAQSCTASYWILMTRTALPSSLHKRTAVHEAVVNRCSKSTGVRYDMPFILKAITAILTEYVEVGTRLYENSYVRYESRKELSFSPIIGAFSEEGLSLLALEEHPLVSCSETGVSVVRRFE